MTERLAYRVREVCTMLGISRATLYRRAKTGEIAIHKLGSASFVKREGLELLMSAMLTYRPISLPILGREIEGDAVRRSETEKRPKVKRRQRLVRQHETA